MKMTGKSALCTALQNVPYFIWGQNLKSQHKKLGK